MQELLWQHCIRGEVSKLRAAFEHVQIFKGCLYGAAWWSINIEI